MKVLFDLSATQPSPDAKFHGGSDYNKFIFFQALKEGYNFDVCYNNFIPLHTEIDSTIKKYNLNAIKFDNINDLKQKIIDAKYDRFFSGLPYLFEEYDFVHTKFYMSILGLRSLEMFSFKEQIPYQNSFLKKIKYFLYDYIFNSKVKKSTRKSFEKLLNIKNKHLFTISNHTKYSILNFFPKIKKEEISVFYAPLDFSIKSRTRLIQEPYFLLVSGNRWIKNNIRAILALDELFSNNQISKIKVVVLGCEGVNFKNKVKNKDCFNFKGYVENEELENYFQNAYVFIYPTLNEGFGYPPVQSMKYGVPVIASAISSVPEVCNDAALYFNPFSVSEIKNRILNLYHDEDLRNYLIKNGFKRTTELKEDQELKIKKMVYILFND